MAAIQNLCDRGMLLHAGMVSFTGTANAGVEKYLSAQKTSIDISNAATIRTGNGLVKIMKIEITDAADNIIDQVYSGQDFKIKLYYKTEKPLSDLNLITGISITNQLEMPVCLHHSRLNKLIFKNIQTSGMFVFEVKKLALVPAVYNLTYSLINEGVYFDGINNVLQMQVIDGDYYGSGEVPPSSHAVCLLDGRWSQQ